jgi:hypothetical protein
MQLGQVSGCGRKYNLSQYVLHATNPGSSHAAAAGFMQLGQVSVYLDQVQGKLKPGSPGCRGVLCYIAPAVSTGRRMSVPDLHLCLPSWSVVAGCTFCSNRESPLS